MTVLLAIAVLLTIVGTVAISVSSPSDRQSAMLLGAAQIAFLVSVLPIGTVAQSIVLSLGAICLVVVFSRVDRSAWRSARVEIVLAAAAVSAVWLSVFFPDSSRPAINAMYISAALFGAASIGSVFWGIRQALGSSRSSSSPPQR